MFEFDKKVLTRIGKRLVAKKQSISVAESVTSGLLQFAFSSMENAVNFYQGGITAYNIGQKFKHLTVEPLHALSVNCVSAKVAVEMARNVCDQFTSDWGIAVTGYATPVPESGNKLFAYYCIVHKNKVKSKGKILSRKQEPSIVQMRYACVILQQLSKQI
jgi:nicotinamide-nucleotide amidase